MVTDDRRHSFSSMVGYLRTNVGKFIGIIVSSNIVNTVHFRARCYVAFLKTVFVPTKWCARITGSLRSRYNKAWTYYPCLHKQRQLENRVLKTECAQNKMQVIFLCFLYFFVMNSSLRGVVFICYYATLQSQPFTTSCDRWINPLNSTTISVPLVDKWH